MLHVNEGSHFDLPPTSGSSHNCLYSQLQTINALWPVLISCPTEGRRLSWPGWLVTYWGGLLPGRRSLMPVLTRLDIK